ncbi:MAG: class I SAM-dependent methyltransferase [archaeon]
MRSCSLYRELAKYYDIIVEPFVETGRENKFLGRILAEHNAKSALDIACGTGRHAIPLSKRGFRITGIDSSRAMIRIARKKAVEKKSKAQFLARDCRKMGFRNAFDAAYCMWNSFYLLPYNGMLRCLNKALKENGILIIDGKDWVNVRKKLKGKSQTVWENELVKGKKTIRIHREDFFTGTRRIVNVEYGINGKRFSTKEAGETIPLGALEKILERHGFRVIEKYRDLKKWSESSSDSVQLVARKSINPSRSPRV